MDTFMNLQRAIQNKRRGKLSHKILLLHDNTWPHSAKVTQALLNILMWEVFPHPPHGPDHMPSDFHLFPAMHVEFAGKHFHCNDELQKAVLTYLQNLLA